MKRAYRTSVKQERSFVAFKSLKTNVNLLRSRIVCPFCRLYFCRVGQNISSRTDFVPKSGLGEEIREKASWSVPVTKPTAAFFLQEGRKEQRNEGRKEKSKDAGPDNYQRNKEHASSTNVQ